MKIKLNRHNREFILNFIYGRVREYCCAEMSNHAINLKRIRKEIALEVIKQKWPAEDMNTLDRHCLTDESNHVFFETIDPDFDQKFMIKVSFEHPVIGPKDDYYGLRPILLDSSHRLFKANEEYREAAKELDAKTREHMAPIERMIHKAKYLDEIEEIIPGVSSLKEKLLELTDPKIKIKNIFNGNLADFKQ